MTPDEHTNQELHLDVGGGHELYVCDWGDKHSEHVFMYFHGGPGGRVDDRAKSSFDPKTQRVIFYDQRGCGKSTPYGSLEHNTTPDLVADVVKILDHLKLKQVIAYGRSWGSTVALAFAVAHPARVRAMIVSGIFTGSAREIDWLDNGRFQTHYPDVWEKYLARAPAEHRKNPTAWHYDNILKGDAHQLFNSALAIEEMEHSIMNMDDRTHPIDAETFDPTSARLFAHYLSNGCFMADRHILASAPKLHMPVWIVQGRYDMDCPPLTAYELYQALPNAHLTWTLSNHRVDHESDNALKLIVQQFGGIGSG